MSNVGSWQPLAGDNISAPPDGAPENMLRSAVNNCMREMMAAVARWYSDQKTVLVTGGSGNVYTLGTSGTIPPGVSPYTNLNQIPILTFRADHANTGPVTLNVDGLGAKNFYKAAGNTTFRNGDIVAGQAMAAVYNPAANAGAGGFELIGPRPQTDVVPAGTVMIFQQTSQPLGWTRVASVDDAALRMVGSTPGGVAGGTQGVSTIFGLAGVTGSHVLIKTELPIYNFDLTTMGATTAGITAPGQAFANNPTIAVATAKNYQTQSGSGDISGVTLDSDRQNVVSRMTGTLALGGGGLGHTHPMGDIKYIDVLSASKN